MACNALTVLEFRMNFFLSSKKKNEYLNFMFNTSSQNLTKSKCDFWNCAKANYNVNCVLHT